VTPCARDVLDGKDWEALEGLAIRMFFNSLVLEEI